MSEYAYVVYLMKPGEDALEWAIAWSMEEAIEKAVEASRRGDVEIRGNGLDVDAPLGRVAMARSGVEVALYLDDSAIAAFQKESGLS